MNDQVQEATNEGRSAVGHILDHQAYSIWAANTFKALAGHYSRPADGIIIDAAKHTIIGVGSCILSLPIAGIRMRVDMFSITVTEGQHILKFVDLTKVAPGEVYSMRALEVIQKEVADFLQTYIGSRADANRDAKQFATLVCNLNKDGKIPSSIPCHSVARLSCN